MAAYEWSKKHNAFTKLCPGCNREFIGDSDEKLAVEILMDSFFQSFASGRADGLQPTCKECSINRVAGRTRIDLPKQLRLQRGKCSICFKKIELRGKGRAQSACQDHDRSNGMNRELLCLKCNAAIGYLGENPFRAERLAVYLRKWKKKHEDH